MKSLSENSAKISINDALRLISTFHSMHAIAGRLSPIDCENSGIETIETNTFKLQVRCCASRRGRRRAPHPFRPSASKLQPVSNFFSLPIHRARDSTPP